MNRRVAFTLIELLIVMATIFVLIGILLPALNGAQNRARGVACLNNLKQWGVATQLYATDHDDFLPPEGSPTPGIGSLKSGWYVALPIMLGSQPYGEMPWRTNGSMTPKQSLFICPSNSRRATNNNLFHYCLNAHLDGTGANDRAVRLSSLPSPSLLVQLFDNGKRAAVAQQNNVHTNLHHRGAHFLFLEGHAQRFPNSRYWDFIRNQGRTDEPKLRWKP